MHWLDRISPCLRIADGRPSPAGWVEALRVVYDHELVMAQAGGYRVDIEGQTVRLDAGTFVIVGPGCWHVSSDAMQRGGYRRWVHFSWTSPGAEEAAPVLTYHPGALREEALVRAPDFVPAGPLCGQIARPARAYDLHEELCARWNRGGAHDRRTARALLLELLLEVLDTSDASSGVPVRHTRGLASAVRRVLEDAAEEPMGRMRSIRDLLSGLGCSYEHAARVFHGAFGVTPTSYVNALRLERARRLLRDSDLGVAEIAYRVGFESAAYFSRVFLRATGLRPSEARRHFREA